ncbi:MAG: arginine--tRNA ligase [Candidatus Omnitrophota bacterium]
MTLVNQLELIVRKSATELWPDIKIPPFDVTTPPAEEFGDLSTALPLTLAKLLTKPPIEIANQIKAQFDQQPLTYIKEVTVTQPGYINFILDYPILSKHLINKILTQKQAYGGDKEDKGKIIIEHTAINPNKAAHIGHLRNACLGDSTANLLRTDGWQVEVQNYIDDTGAQVADVIVAIENLPDKQGKQLFDYFCWDIYAKIQKMYEVDEKLKERRDEVLHLLEEGNNPTAKTASQITNKIVSRHLETLSRLNIAYNLLVWERDIIDMGLWPAVFADLKQKKLIHQSKRGEHKGAWVVEFGETERENKILVKSNGVATYTAKDLAYQLWKFGLIPIDFEYYTRTLQWDGKPLLTTKGGTFGIKNLETAQRNFSQPNKVINVIDLRQSYPQEVIKETLDKLGYANEAENSIHLRYQVVKLSLGAVKELGIKPEIDKEEYAMSGREGIGVKIDDLMDKVEEKISRINPQLSPEDVQKMASATIRYYMLRNRATKEIIFDFDEALKTDGNTGAYLQYAHARCCSILNKVTGWQPLAHHADMPKDSSPETNQLIKLVEDYPRVLELAADELDPSLLTDFAFTLASTFSKFYEKNPVLSADDDIKNFRLHLVATVKQVLANLLSTIGIIPLEKI